MLFSNLPTMPVTGLLILFILWISVTPITALVPRNGMKKYTKFIKIQLMTFLALMTF